MSVMPSDGFLLDTDDLFAGNFTAVKMAVNLTDRLVHQLVATADRLVPTAGDINATVPANFSTYGVEIAIPPW